jgi:hypothetical protein
MVREIREGKYIVLEPKREAPKKARKIAKPSRKAKTERTLSRATRTKVARKSPVKRGPRKTTAKAKSTRRRAS